MDNNYSHTWDCERGVNLPPAPNCMADNRTGNGRVGYWVDNPVATTSLLLREQPVVERESTGFEVTAVLGSNTGFAFIMYLLRDFEKITPLL